jgi:hypothetical protein
MRFDPHIVDEKTTALERWGEPLGGLKDDHPGVLGHEALQQRPEARDRRDWIRQHERAVLRPGVRYVSLPRRQVMLHPSLKSGVSEGVRPVFMEISEEISRH